MSKQVGWLFYTQSKQFSCERTVCLSFNTECTKQPLYFTHVHVNITSHIIDTMIVRKMNRMTDRKNNRMRQTDSVRQNGWNHRSKDAVDTLRVLVHRAGWGSHATVPTLSHAHTLHLTVALIFGNAFLEHAFHGLQNHKNK